MNFFVQVHVVHIFECMLIHYRKRVYIMKHETANPSGGASEFNPSFKWGSHCSIVSFCV